MKNRIELLSGNQLKLIAAFCMVVDHVGFLLFPNIEILRIIGRIAFPIFAFMIAEGCYYTHNKLRYFLSIFILGAACQIVYFLFDHSLFLGILIAYSIAIVLIFEWQALQKALFTAQKQQQWLWGAVFGFSIIGTYILTMYVEIDYGFWGIMMPLLISLTYPVKGFEKQNLTDRERLRIQVLLMAFSMIGIAKDLGSFQLWLLLALPFVLCYSGKRGKLKMKTFFYVFYPAHLVIIQAIAYLMGK